MSESALNESAANGIAAIEIAMSGIAANESAVGASAANGGAVSAVTLCSHAVLSHCALTLCALSQYSRTVCPRLCTFTLVLSPAKVPRAGTQNSAELAASAARYCQQHTNRLARAVGEQCDLRVLMQPATPRRHRICQVIELVHKPQLSTTGPTRHCQSHSAHKSALRSHPLLRTSLLLATALALL